MSIRASTISFHRAKIPHIDVVGRDLIIGVTGHRDLCEPDKAAIASLIEDELLHLCNELCPGRIIIHTPFARGADRLIADAAQSLKLKIDTPICIRAVLPMPEVEYIASEDSEHRDSLASLLEAHREHAILLNQHTDNTKSDFAETCFASLSDHFGFECDIVFCLWDGLRNGKKGGTGDIVDRLLSMASTTRCKTLLSLTCPRNSNPYPTSEKFTWKVYTKPPVPKMPIKLSRHCKLTSLAFLALFSVICGAIGYSMNGLSLLDSVPVAISHLVLNGFNDSDPNGYLRLSRWSGLLFFGISAAALIERLFHTWTWFEIKRRQAKPHDIICGLGWRGKALLGDGDSLPVIAIDIAPDHSATELCNAHWTPIKRIDACEKNSLRGKDLLHTRRAFICTGSDEVNLRVVHYLASNYRDIQNQRSRNTHLICSVGIESTENFRALAESVPKDSDIDLRIFNTESVTARLFLRENHIDRFQASPNALGARVVVIGDGSMAETLTRFLIQQGIFEESKALEIVRLVTNHEIAANAFVSKFPCFKIDTNKSDSNQSFVVADNETWTKEKVLPTVRYYEIASSESSLQKWISTHLSVKGEWVTTVIIAKHDPIASSATAMATAPALQEIRKISKLDVALWFLFNHREDSIRNTAEKNLDDKFPDLHVRAFSDFLGICNRLRATGDDSDIIAKRVHSAYLGADLSDEQVLQDNWKGISEEDKDSSRQCAEHCFVKLRVRDRLQLKSDKDLHRKLAEVEHRRWCAEKLMKGVEPLTRIPSEIEGGFVRSVLENTHVEQWFHADKPTRKAYTKWQKLHLKHIDLIPFSDLAILYAGKQIEKDGKIVPLGIHEENKDHAIIENLNAILGVEGLSSSKLSTTQ